ncbi:MAG TPA: hypothetical protein VMV10_21995 [Pirellulales bacterium]|nr:hypothetical protein [Pirellulales bacterium]
MKRLLFRLSALIGVLAVGTAAIVQAQRSLSRAEAQEPRARVEPVAAKSTVKTKKNSLRTEKPAGAAPQRPAADPFLRRPSDDRYADRYRDAADSTPPEEFNAAEAPPGQAEPPADNFPDAAAVRGLADARRAPAGEVRNPFAGDSTAGGAASGPAFGAEGAKVQLVAANEAEDRYAPGSIRDEPPPAPLKNSKKKVTNKVVAAEAPNERSPAGFFGAERDDRPGNDLRAPDEREQLVEELPAADAIPERTANGGFRTSRQSSAERPLAGGELAGDEGRGKPGGKHLEGPQTPSLTLEKIAPEEIQVGKPAIFEIRVRNAGQVAAQGVEIYEQIPQGTRMLSADPPATQAEAGEVVWAIGALQPGEETKVSLEVMPLAEGEIGSVATVHFASEASARTICTRPQLTLDVQAPREVLVGEDAKLSITVANPGTGKATDVVLSESIPGAFSHPAGPELEYEIGDLKPGETRKLELTLKAVQGGAAVNRLLARADAQLTAERETELMVVAPKLEVALEGPKRRYLERRATYTMRVSNPGTAPAKEVELVAHLPKGLEFVEANNAGHYDPQTQSVHWLLEELPPNQTGQVTLTMLPVEPGEQMLRLEGTAERGLSAEQQETIQIEGVAAILFQVVDAADPIEVGGETTYEIRVVNQGSKVATNIQLRAELPAELKPLDAQGPVRYSVDGQAVEFEPLARLAPKADTTYRLRVQGLRPGDLRVQIQLKTDEMETPVTKEESTRVYADE